MTIKDRVGHYLQTGRAWYNRVNDIKVITVHHDAIPHSDKTDEQLMQQIMNTHVGKKGWPGFSYHYWISKSGAIYQVNQDNWITWHDGINNDSLGVCLNGYFHADHNNDPTPQQLQSLAFLKEHLKTKYSSIKEFKGHRDRANTACPGDNMYFLLDSLEGDMSQELIEENKKLKEQVTKLEGDVTSARSDRGNLLHALTLVPEPGPKYDYDNKKAVQLILDLRTASQERDNLKITLANTNEVCQNMIAGLKLDKSTFLDDFKKQTGTYVNGYKMVLDTVLDLKHAVTGLILEELTVGEIMVLLFNKLFGGLNERLSKKTNKP